MSADAQRQQKNERKRTIFKQRLDTAMKTRGESALSLSKRLGISHTTIGRWLGGSQPGADQIEKLSEALSVNAQWLLTGEGDGPDTIIREIPPVIGSELEEAVKKMSAEELLRGIAKNLALANDPDLQSFRATYAKIIEAFARELSSRSGDGGTKARTKYS